MKLTKETLKQIIREELEAVMSEGIGGAKGLMKYLDDLNVEQQTKTHVADLVSRIKMSDDDAEQMAFRISQEDPEAYLASWISDTEDKLSQGELTDYGAMYEDKTK